MRAPSPVFSYETLFLSDLHLGSGKTASPYLYEFITHLNPHTLKEIYLVGDIIGGWEQSHQKQRPFDEMERRIFDVLNHLASTGVKLHYIPGNHDERLRGVHHKGRTVDVMGMLNRAAARNPRKGRIKTFSENIEFKHHDTRVFGDKTYRITHSDLHDPETYTKWWFKPIVYGVSHAYDTLIAFDAWLNKFAHKHFKKDFPIAKTLKHWFKEKIESVVSGEALVQELEHDSCDGAFIGHTHMPGVHRINRNGREYTIVNDGDWQEGGSAAFIAPGDTIPQIIEYRMERHNFFAVPLPDEKSPHAPIYAAHRERTNRQIRLIRRMWPARRKSRLAQLDRYRRAGAKMREHLHDIQLLDTALEHLNGRMLDKVDSVKAAITDTARHKHRFDQRKGEIKDIFARSAKNGVFKESDRQALLAFAKELRAHACTKMNKHFNDRCKAAQNLNYVTMPAHPLPAASEQPRKPALLVA